MEVNNYRVGLQQLIAGHITYSDFFGGPREDMILALCRGLIVDDATRQELGSLEHEAHNLGLL